MAEHPISCLLSDQEKARLQAICMALNIPVHEVLMIGVRRCERRLAEEQRRQQGQSGHQ